MHQSPIPAENTDRQGLAGGAGEIREQCLRKAIRIAREQSAKSEELAAVIILARLLASHGRRDETRAMLARICNWFTEGFDTADLKDTEALLDELGR